MSDIILHPGHAPNCQVFLDGHLQWGVAEVNLTRGQITRAYCGEPGPGQDKVGLHGAVFDLEEEEFVLEVVHGDVTVKWQDPALGRKWMEKLCDA